MLCSAIMINLSSEAWVEVDYKNLETAKLTCKKRYNSKCVKKFVKKDKLTYYAICGD